MTHVTCRLTAKNRDQPRNPTLGNRAWATFTFLGTAQVVGFFHLAARLWHARDGFSGSLLQLFVITRFELFTERRIK